MADLLARDALPEPPVTTQSAELQLEAPAPARRNLTLGQKLKRALAPLLVLAAKAKTLILLLLKVKLLVTFGSMLVSVAAYGIVFGWPFAVGFVALLLLHELGHVIQLRREGVEASAPVFIPFLGAAIAAKSLGKDAAAEARVGLAGPILGSAATLVPLTLWLATGSPFWRALAYIGFFLNLFNLLPVVPLDGGRAMAALSPAFWFVGLGALVALAIFYPSPILFVILIFGAMECWRRWRARKEPEGHAYYSVAPRTRALIAALYVGLAAALAFGVVETFAARSL